MRCITECWTDTGQSFLEAKLQQVYLFDAILELMTPVGLDGPMMVTALTRSRLNFKMYHSKKPRDMIVRAKELRVKFETWSITFEEKNLVDNIVIPLLSLACEEVTEQHQLYADYPVPKPKDVSTMAVHKHLVQSVTTLDELMIRLQRVIPRKDPLEYINVVALVNVQENSSEHSFHL